MKKYLLFFTLFFLATSSLPAQLANTSVSNGSAAPVGACVSGSFYVAANTGIDYICVSSAWQTLLFFPAGDLSSLAIGSGALAAQTNTSTGQNVGIGTNAGHATTSGTNNIAIGHSSLTTNIIGNSNLAIGHLALNLATGDSNMAIGSNALASLGTGTGNTAVGYFSAYGNSINFNASNNTALGFDALADIQTNANNNTGLGYAALGQLTTGVNNTGVGYNALTQMGAGSDNTAVGQNVMQNAAGSSANKNVAIGEAAFTALTSGSQNVAVGYQAGYTANGANGLTTGTNDTFIGFQSGPNTSTQLSNATALGYQTLNSASNQVVLGNSSVTDVYSGSVSAAAVEHAAKFVGIPNNGIINFNRAAQSQVVVSATEYYITRSDLDMPAAYATPIAAGTTMKWRIALTKTAAGTGTFQILLKKGTNGSTADTSIVTQTIGTQTAVADNMEADIVLTWTSATAAYWTIVPHQSATTGTGFGLVYPAAAAQFTGTISAQTTTTVSDKYGLSMIFTTGTPTFVVNMVQAQAFGVN